MKWVLIWFFWTYHSSMSGSAQFDTQTQCEAAKRKIVADLGNWGRNATQSINCFSTQVAKP